MRVIEVFTNFVAPNSQKPLAFDVPVLVPNEGSVTSHNKELQRPDHIG